MLQFLKRHAVLSVAFAAALVVTLVFLVRFTISTLVWSDPDLYQQPIAGWMTPRYVARSWQVPPEVVAEALGLERDGTGRRMTLEAIAAAQGRTLDDLKRALEEVLGQPRRDADG